MPRGRTDPQDAQGIDGDRDARDAHATDAQGGNWACDAPADTEGTEDAEDTRDAPHSGWRVEGS